MITYFKFKLYFQKFKYVIFNHGRERERITYIWCILKLEFLLCKKIIIACTTMYDQNWKGPLQCECECELCLIATCKVIWYIMTESKILGCLGNCWSKQVGVAVHFGPQFQHLYQIENYNAISQLNIIF